MPDGNTSPSDGAACLIGQLPFSSDECCALLEAAITSGVAPDRLLPCTGVAALMETVTLIRHALGCGVSSVVMLPPFCYIGEGGLPGFEFQSWYGVWPPKGTPAAINERVNALMQETMRDPVIVQRLTSQVLEPVTESIAETRRFIATEINRATELLRSANYQPE
jgi:hypothetical protein